VTARGWPAATPPRLRSAIEAVAAVLRLDAPADTALARHFRDRPAAGRQDRAFAAEAVYAVLRRLRTLERLAQPASAAERARRVTLACLATEARIGARQLEPALRRGETEWLAGLDAEAGARSAAERHELPDWLEERLAADYPPAELDAIMDALNRPAALDLRVNTLLATRAEVLARLRAAGLDAQPTPWSPYGLRLTGRPSVHRMPLYTEGAVEVQDEGSQLLGLLLGARRREMIVDFCAGAGGKTLLIGARMANTGRVYAFDASAQRLAGLGPRLRRSGLSNVHPQAIAGENDARIRRLAGKIDRVLVDAPCSGLGTLRRSPWMKWRLSAAQLAALVATQRALLDSAQRLVKPGGRLVYATCSILAEENDAAVDAFLARHGEWREGDAAAELRGLGIGLDTGPRLRLFPHRHGTDGYYAAILERRR
jgi:16S rRNA (cytosine967-C5)-methyltransferase